MKDSKIRAYRNMQESQATGNGSGEHRKMLASRTYQCDEHAECDDEQLTTPNAEVKPLEAHGVRLLFGAARSTITPSRVCP
jgi:hypothetical protein